MTSSDPSRGRTQSSGQSITKRLTRPIESRGYSALRYVQQLGRFTLPKSFHINQPQHFTHPRRQGINRRCHSLPKKIIAFDANSCINALPFSEGLLERRLVQVTLECFSPPIGRSRSVQVGSQQDAEQPRPPGAKLAQFIEVPERAKGGVLH